MRIVTTLALLLAACSSANSSTVEHTAMPTPSATSRPTPVAGCQPTQRKDATGVITVDGRTGIVGDTFAVGEVMNGGASVVRRGAVASDHIKVEFHQIGNTAPATWVAYDVAATARVTPWGSVVFNIGWKPIAFEDSCWRLIVDGADTGIVLAIGR